MDFLLFTLLLLPLVGSAMGAFLPSGKAARVWGLSVSLLTAVIGLLIANHFFNGVDVASDRATDVNYRVSLSKSAIESLSISAIGFSVNMGVDAISMWLVILTIFLMPLAVLASFGSIKEREKEYYAWMSMLLGAMLGVFLARDALLFYVFFELTLIPMFFIIGIWGGPERRFAAGKFFLFTFAGSVFTLAAVVYLATRAKSGAMSFNLSDIVDYAQRAMTPTERYWVVLGLLAGFAVKVPLFPVHTWLPLAHTEAPTAGSVILAGVLLKLGTYGILRIAVPIGLIAKGQVVSLPLIHVLGTLSVIAVIYGALVAWVQQDIKKLVAYSSVSHMGFCVLGMVALNDTGMQGSVLYMINHGISTGALFLVIGMIYDRYHTRDINALSGLAKNMPVMAFFFILFTMSSIGLPGTNGFVSEFLTILGAFTSPYLGMVYGVFASLGILLGAIYMLHMAAKVIFGPLKIPAHDHADKNHKQDDAQDHGDHGHDHSHGHVVKNDLNAREIGILVPLAIAVIVLGVMPNTVLKSILGPIKAIGPQPQTTTQTVPAPIATPAATPVIQVRN